MHLQVIIFKLQPNKMKSTIAFLLAVSSASAFAPQQASRSSVKLNAESREGLQTLAKELNPIVGFYDP